MKTVALLSICIVVAMATNNNLPEVELPPIVGEGGALPPGYGSPPSTCYISKQYTSKYSRDGYTPPPAPGTGGDGSPCSCEF
uniref:Uncharacterized protein n=1 Tax=Acrobeloides nanus TaxID=290746 RepID=A0A914E0E7_9BILA